MTNHWFGGHHENLRVTIAGHPVLIVAFKRDQIAWRAPVSIELVRNEGRYGVTEDGWHFVDFDGDRIRFRVRYSDDPEVPDADRCWITVQAPRRFRFAWGDYRPSWRRLAPAPLKSN